MEHGRGRLIDLIDYVEATERDRLKTVLDARDHKGFFYAEADLADLPGVALDRELNHDVVWLQVDRLAKISPPTPFDDELKLWLSLRDNPDHPPKLNSEIPRPLLFEAGLIEGDDGPTSIRLEDYEHANRVRTAFETFVSGDWELWALAERPRRKSIALYNALFGLRQMLEGATETPVELVCGIGFSTLFRANQRLRYPLLTVQLEIALNDFSHAIEVRPRMEAIPGIEADVLDKLELASVNEWHSFATKTLAALEDEPLSPFALESFEPSLRLAVALLDPDAIYLPDSRHPDDRSIPAVGPTLQVSDVFAFFQRERRATQLMEDLRRFRVLIEGAEDEIGFPEAITAVITEPANGPSSENYPTFRGISTIPGVTSSTSGKDLFFPKPFNREQVEVVQRLALRPGVVVQGPPGTGKTHTIANIISHYLALGKRVLVTSQKAPALRVLRDQLPAAVRPLAVSLLDSDRDGLKQFQESVDIIAERLQRTKRHELAREIQDLEVQIDNLHRKLARIDKEVDEIGRSATATIDLDGESVDPLNAAREVAANVERSEWIEDDIAPDPKFAPTFSDSDIIALRQARRLIGSDLVYLSVQLPRQAHFPDDETLISIHRDLSRSEQLRRRISTGELMELADQASETLELASQLLADLKALAKSRHAITSSSFAWSDQVTSALRRNPREEGYQVLSAMEPEISALCEDARHFLSRPIELPEGTLDDQKLLEAINRCARGEPPVGAVAGLFASSLKARLSAIRIVGEKPRAAPEWAEVIRYIESLSRAKRLKLSWNHAAPHTSADIVSIDGLAVPRLLKGQLDELAAIRTLIETESQLESLASRLLPRWTTPISGDPAATTALIETIESHLLRARLAQAEATRRRLIDGLNPCGGEVSAQFRSCLLDHLGNPEIDDAALRREWAALRLTLDTLVSKQPAFETVARVSALIERSGASRWATLLRSEVVVGQTDPWTPGDWEERWRLKRLGAWLAKTDRHGRLRTLGVERTGSETTLKEAYERSIELKTWLELRTKATDSVQSALAAYADAVRRIGRGTGKRAARYRRDARAASDRAKSALPCWIMPHYRVSESLPADLGLFDLVIVDEASQSTVAALPALLRAKQILIVGDDRQVSPENVGRDQERADELARRHLSAQVVDYRSALREEQSLYDLGKVVFAGGAIMLAEHFRCVAPIIEFSKAQFYGHRLLPLRLPTASQRLDPPLIDILVVDGYRKGKTNPPEADCIVSEIRKIVDDPAMAKRTIGVTTLLGQEQAALIYSRVEQDIGTELMEKHHIRVGDPTAFQGDERDIMFVSLVAEKQDSPLAGTGYEQRFNVATSRARDRMILVRSVELEDLRSSDKLRRALLEHFRAPFASEGKSAVSRRERCESGFETEMFDMLAERGYRIDTQVPVGNFRIDLVVEGENDRRLAIECDGDRYHGPDKWSDDMVRQRILERAGWEIWRCFASRFVRDREGVTAELLALLQERGIEPVGSGEGWVSRHTEQRRWSSSLDVSPTLNAEEHHSLDDQEPKPSSILGQVQLNNASFSLTSDLSESLASRVSEGLVQREILHLLRDGKPWTNAEIKRALSSTLPLSTADRAQANFRPNEEKWEELVNNALSAARGNSLHAKGLIQSGGRGVHILAEPESSSRPDVELSNSVVVPFSPISVRAHGETYPAPTEATVYRIANFDTLSIKPDPSNLYEAAYSPTLRQLVSQIISVEGPIYDDVLAVRIARLHGKDRTGPIIRDLALSAVEARFPRTQEDDRVLFWPEGASSEDPIPFRKSLDGLRSHSDIPFAELASIALPFIQSGLSEDTVLQKMADTFGLARLRQATRNRFLAGLELARRSCGYRSEPSQT